MIPRYTSKEMGSIWTEENEDRNIVKVEVTACEAMNKLGIVPDDALHDIQTKADFDLDRVHEIEKTTNHDIISLLTSVAEHVGDASKYIHKGLTSNDVKDTAMGLMMKHSAEILIREEKELHEILKSQAQKYRHTLCVGRTHGIHAEPMTFGLKFLLWMSETERNIERLEMAKKYISVGKLSGAIGTYSNIDPFVEKYVCEKLGLTPVPIANQVVQRDRHAFYLSTIAVCGATLEKMATEVRHLQRTEVREAEEYFAPGQKGSSAMPHKRNPITCEKVCGMARVLRGNAEAAIENVALWHERDISHSSVERIIIPDSTILLDHMLRKMKDIMGKMLVYPEASGSEPDRRPDLQPEPADRPGEQRRAPGRRLQVGAAERHGPLDGRCRLQDQRGSGSGYRQVPDQGRSGSLLRTETYAEACGRNLRTVWNVT